MMGKQDSNPLKVFQKSKSSLSQAQWDLINKVIKSSLFTPQGYNEKEDHPSHVQSEDHCNEKSETANEKYERTSLNRGKQSEGSLNKAKYQLGQNINQVLQDSLHIEASQGARLLVLALQQFDQVIRSIKTKKDKARRSQIYEDNQDQSFKEILQMKNNEHQRQVKELQKQIQRLRYNSSKLIQTQKNKSSGESLMKEKIQHLNRDIKKYGKDYEKSQDKIRQLEQKLVQSERTSSHFEAEALRATRLQQQINEMRQQTSSRTVKLRNHISYVQSRNNFNQATDGKHIDMLKRQAEVMEQIEKGKLDPKETVRGLFQEMETLNDEIVMLRELVVKKQEETRNSERTQREMIEKELARNEANRELGWKIESTAKEILQQVREVLDWGSENSKLKQENSELKEQSQSREEREQIIRQIANDLQEIKRAVTQNVSQERLEQLYAEGSRLRVMKVELECRVKVLSERYLAQVRHTKFLQNELDKLRSQND